jgi:cytochrome-b5 reductase
MCVGEWTYSVGFVNADMCRSHLPPPAAEDDALIVMCGPPPMVQMACQPALDSLDYPAHKRFVY